MFLTVVVGGLYGGAAKDVVVVYAPSLSAVDCASISGHPLVAGQ